MKIDRRAFLSQVGRTASAAALGSVLPSIIRPASMRDSAIVERTVFAMGTTVSITAHGPDRALLLSATTRAFEELTRMDRLLSVFCGSSEISSLNHAAGREPIRISPATAELLRSASIFSQLSDGSFDITVEPLMDLWGFRERPHRRWPSDRELAEAREGLGWRRVDVSPDGWAFLTHPRTRIDVGGIGVGFTVDRMGEILRREGVTSALIDHSGDLLAIGSPPDEDGWPVAIPDPLDPETLLVHMSLCDRAISTSSNRRTTRMLDGIMIGHIVDPRTGKNPEGPLSVTVVAPTSTEADALSTTLFVEGPHDTKWRNGQRESIVVVDAGRERRVHRIR